jgi:hypothetical protein
MTLTALLIAVQSALGADVCSDAYMTRQIQPYADRAQMATGLCPTAKAGIALYQKSISLVNKCLNDPELRAYKVQLEDNLRAAKRQAAAYCG